MNRNYFLNILSLLLFYPFISFPQKSVAEKNFTEYQINDTDINGLKQGYWRSYMALMHVGRRNIVYEGMYYNDKQVGVWRKITYTGFVCEIEIFYDTLEFLAERILYYPDGKIKAKGYVSSLPVNDTVFVYDEEKKDLSKPMYIKEAIMKQGRWIYYYDSGNEESEGQYIADKKKGVWKYYNEKGGLIEEEEY
mgnify:FL=1